MIESDANMKPGSIEYPCLMISTGNADPGTVVLFDKPHCGVLLMSKNIAIGVYSENWSDDFIPFYGTITLKNA